LKSLICNLKMNHTLKEMIEYKKILEDQNNASFLLCPPTCYLPLMHSKNYRLCAQNVSSESVERLTGEISLEALKSLDVHSFLLGHSETKDTWEMVLEKVDYITKKNSYAYVIVSDNEEDFNYQYTTYKLLEKMKEVLEKVRKDKYDLVTFIYEPEWLVGKNTPMDIEFVNNTIYQIKKELKAEYKVDFKIYYGGGLTMETISSYLSSSYIDGLLLGSVSFNVKNVLKILQNDNFRQN